MGRAEGREGLGGQIKTFWEEQYVGTASHRPFKHQKKNR